MRRLDRALTDPTEIEALLAAGQVCCLGLNAPEAPYVVPLNYGYTFEEGRLTLYFHSAAEGRKLDLLAQDARASFCIALPGALVRGESACHYGYTFGCVLGEGELTRIEEADARAFGLERILLHYDEKAPRVFEPAMLARTAVLRLRVTSFSAKAKKD